MIKKILLIPIVLLLSVTSCKASVIIDSIQNETWQGYTIEELEAENINNNKYIKKNTNNNKEYKKYLYVTYSKVLSYILKNI